MQVTFSEKKDGAFFEQDKVAKGNYNNVNKKGRPKISSCSVFLVKKEEVTGLNALDCFFFLIQNVKMEL